MSYDASRAGGCVFILPHHVQIQLLHTYDFLKTCTEDTIGFWLLLRSQGSYCVSVLSQSTRKTRRSRVSHLAP